MGGGGRNAAAPPNVKAGITFPIGNTATFLKDHTSGSSSPQFTANAAVLFAATLEYLTAELTELSGNTAIEENTEVIRPKHVYSAVRNDRELSELLHKLGIEIDNNQEEEEEDDDDDEEYDYNSVGEEEIDKIPSDMVEECDDADAITDKEDVTVGESVVLGQMSIAPGCVELYMRLIDTFGEIMSPNLPNYKVASTCAAIADLLNLVETMVDIAPQNILQEMVSDWEGRVSFYGDIGLKVGWLEDRVRRCSDWLVNVNQLRGRVAAKQEELKQKRKEVCALETELQELSGELETAQLSQSQFEFSFFDDS